MRILAAWLFLIVGGARLPVADQTAILRDDLGHPFRLVVPPERIVSLAPNITETLFALNLGQRIVGVTRYCDFPPAAAGKEKVGGLVDPSLEKIQVLHPDLIIAFRGNPIGIINKLRSLGFPVFVFDAGPTLDDLLAMIRRMGRLTFQADAAAQLCRGLEDRRRQVALALRDVRMEPRVFLSLHGQALWTCGADSYLNDLIVQARGTNIAGRIRRRWLNLTMEQLLHEDPEVIVVMAKDLESFRAGREKLGADPRLKEITAVRTGNISFLDENIASRFGPRLFQALADMARILHPERFAKRS
jgi:iron complex transport system substrate-binding protein